MRKSSSYTFADQSLANRPIYNATLSRIDGLLNWDALDMVIRRYYSVGSHDTGCSAYSGLLLFKLLLLESWYRLSDRGVIDFAGDSLSCLRFLGLGLDDPLPDYSNLSRFRQALGPDGMDALLKAVNEQLMAIGVMVSSGTIVDATIIDSPVRRPEQDDEANYTSRPNQPARYGYKAHVATDTNGRVVAAKSTAAHEHESPMMSELLDKVVEQRPLGKVYADKGYNSQANRDAIQARGGENGIMYKAKPKKPLTAEEKAHNRQVSSVRYRIERTFGGIKQWFGGHVTRYKGLAKFHMGFILHAIAYNLWRHPLFAQST
jgi:transposase, IS5 family